MSPTKDTMVYLLLARVAAQTGRMLAATGNWHSASGYVTQAGEYMKKVKWELVK